MSLTRTPIHRTGLLASIAGLALVAGSLLVAPAASATSANLLSDEEAASIAARWDSYGVEQTTQEALFEKINSGQLPDDMVEGAVPVSIEQRGSGALLEEVRTYPDGSIAVLALTDEAAEPAAGGVSARHVEKCSARNTSTHRIWTGCVAKGTFTMVQLSFAVDLRATLRIGGGYGYAFIDRYYSGWHSCGALITCSGAQWGDIRMQQGPSGLAKVTRTVEWSGTTIAGGGGITALVFEADRNSFRTN